MANSIKHFRLSFFLDNQVGLRDSWTEELKENSWVIAKVKSEVIMASWGSDSWKSLLRSFNNKYRIWAEFPESPEMN